MITLGVDPSTKTGLVLLEHKNSQWTALATVVTYPKLTGWRRAQSIAAAVAEWCSEHPDAAVIEGYSMRSMARSGLTTVTLIEIGTLIRRELQACNVPWYVVPPTTLKAYVTGAGNAKKPQVALAVKGRWGFESKSDDIVDAYVLARMGHVLLSNEADGAPALKGVSREHQ